MKHAETIKTLSITTYAIALAVWSGGLVVLGAVVAPTVFRIVPAPTSADAMTVVFQRFDRIAMTAAAVALVAEAALAWRCGKPKREDFVRGAAIAVAAIFAIAEGAYLSPAIAKLHTEGARRGLGDAGLRLEGLHHLAETLAKSELVLLVLGIALLVRRATRPVRA